jgi:hypothetical protein
VGLNGQQTELTMQKHHSNTSETSQTEPVVFAEWDRGNLVLRLELCSGRWIRLVTYVRRGEKGKLFPTNPGVEIPREVIPTLREGLIKLEAGLSGEPRQKDLDELEN